jgi:hypothetical protein
VNFFNVLLQRKVQTEKVCAKKGEDGVRHQIFVTHEEGAKQRQNGQRAKTR